MLFLILKYIALGLAVILTFAYLFMTRRFRYWDDKSVVSPKPVVFFGNVKDLALRRMSFGKWMQRLYEAFPNEKIVGFYRYWNPALLVRDPEIIKHIMIKDFGLFVDRGLEINKKNLGYNMFHADNETWRILRNKFSPLFSSGKLKGMLYLMKTQAEKFTSLTEDICTKTPESDIYPLIQVFTTGNIATCAFGFEPNLEEVSKPGGFYTKLDKAIFNLPFAFEIDAMFPGLLKKMNIDFFAKPVVDFFHNIVSDVMRERDGKSSGRKDFMDLLLDLKNSKVVHGSKLSEEDSTRSIEITEDIMAAQAFAFYAGGYGTSASTFSHLLYHLALNQDIQEKVIEEIDGIINKCNGDITYETLNEISYFSQVVSETLRMYPLVEPLQRVLLAPKYKIPGTNVTIEKGTMVFISGFGLHHDKEYFEEPLKFNPDRFAEGKDQYSSVYLPFGTGPRNCIGMRFAYMAMKILALYWFRKFRVYPTEKTPEILEFRPNRIIIGVKDGIMLRITKR